MAGLAAFTLGYMGEGAAADLKGLPNVLRTQTGQVVRFQGANLPGQPYIAPSGVRTLEINQTAERAVLHWKNFDIDANSEVRFNQPGPSSIALNRVFSDTDVPSIIDGRLTANGRVFLINRNGIVFGKNSQVNTRSLVASTLNIEDQVFEEIGFVRAINEPEALAAFDSKGEVVGDIVIELGAELKSGKGGRIMIFANSVTNAGTIESEEGQVVLAAAADKVYIAAPKEEDDLRGLLVEVSTGGDVSNLGKVISERGNVSIIGMAVNQEGLVRATTSVSLDGSIRLVAQDMNGGVNFGSSGLPPRQLEASRGGELVLGGDSVTEVVPSSDGALAPDAQAQPQSGIRLAGSRVEIGGNSRVTATGGRVDIVARANPDDVSGLFASDPLQEDSEVVLSDNALIDVSGDRSTEVSVARNIIEVEARGNELADSPVQREGPIRNKTLRVDLREGTDFLNIDQAAAGLQRGVNERLSTGGTVDIQTEGMIRIGENALVDISGGQVAYRSGTVATSKLVTADGGVIDIADADPDLAYAGVLDSLELVNKKWGVTERYSTAADTFEPGYIEGRDAGSLVLEGRDLDFRGRLYAETVAGRLQRELPAGVSGFKRNAKQRALGGELELTLLQNGDPELLLGGVADPRAANSQIVLNPGLFTGNGISRLTVSNAGRLVVAQPLVLPAGGEVALTGRDIDVLADISVPSGSVLLTGEHNFGETGGRQLIGSIADVNVEAAIDVAGRWVNDSSPVNPEPATGVVALSGGSIDIATDDNLHLGEAGLLDVSGGAWLDVDGDFTAGSGGDIALRSGVISDGRQSTRLDLEGELRGFGFAHGGALDLSAEQVLVRAGAGTGSSQTQLLGQRFGLLPAAGDDAPYIFTIAADSFRLGGFEAFSLSSTRGGIEVADGARLPLTQANLVLDPVTLGSLVTAGQGTNGAVSNGHPLELVPSGGLVSRFTRTEYLPSFERRPVDFALRSTENLDVPAPSALSVGSGAQIRAEAGASVSLASDTSLFFDGAVDAPAGTIELAIDDADGDFEPEQKIWLGPNASLTANGAVRIDPVNNEGLRLGEVLDAGSIRIRADRGSIIGAQSALISVDGAAATLSVGKSGIGGRRTVSSHAGGIHMSAAEAVVFSGALSGRAGSESSFGGELSITLDPSTRGSGPVQLSSNALYPRGPHVALFADYAGELPDRDEPVGEELLATAYVPVERIGTGGFDALAVSVRSSADNTTTDSGDPLPDTPESLPVIAFEDDLELRLDRRIVLDAAVFTTDAASARDRPQRR